MTILSRLYGMAEYLLSSASRGRWSWGDCGPPIFNKKLDGRVPRLSGKQVQACKHKNPTFRYRGKAR